MTSALAPSDLAADDASDERVGVPRSIGRVLDLLEIVLAAGTCTLSTAARTSGLTPTTALRYLRALEARGYLGRDGDGNYAAGPTVLRLASSLRAVSPLDRLVVAAQPVLARLAQQTGESAYLAVSDGTTGTYVATAESARAIRHVGWVGQHIDLPGSALGAALEQPGSVVSRTGAVEPDITAMCRALGDTGRLGIAVSIVGPAHRFTNHEQSRHRRDLDAAADDLEQAFRRIGEDRTP